MSYIVIALYVSALIIAVLALLFSFDKNWNK